MPQLKRATSAERQRLVGSVKHLKAIMDRRRQTHPDRGMSQTERLMLDDLISAVCRYQSSQLKRQSDLLRLRFRTKTRSKQHRLRFSPRLLAETKQLTTWTGEFSSLVRLMYFLLDGYRRHRTPTEEAILNEVRKLIDAGMGQEECISELQRLGSLLRPS